MPVLLTDEPPVYTEHATPNVFIVHIKRQIGLSLALCGDKFGSYVTAQEGETLPYIITSLEVFCSKCLMGHAAPTAQAEDRRAVSV